MLKPEETGSMSDLLFALERRGLDPETAQEAVLLAFHWGVAAALDRLRPTRPRLPGDAPAIPLHAQLTLIDGGEEKSKKKKARPAMVQRRIPDDFTLTPERTQYALDRGFDRRQASDMFEEFTGWYRKTGKAWADWDAVWQGWVREQVKRTNEKRAASQPNMIDGRL